MIQVVPVTVITGFLGAGKTTLLKRLLHGSHGVRIGVLVNDFGELGIDAELVSTSDATAVQLANGCICCTLREGLSAAIINVLDREDAPQHLVVEASGISDPVAIAEALHRFPLNRRVSVDAIVAVIDAEQYPHLSFEDGETALAQMAVADIVLINKIDLAGDRVVAALRTELSVIVPRARILETTHSDVPWELIVGAAPDHHERPAFGEHRLEGNPPDLGSTHGFRSVAWESDEPLSAERFRRFVSEIPVSVFRAKGLLSFGTDARAAVFHLVGKRSSLDFEDVPPSCTGSRVVFTGRCSNEVLAALGTALDSCIA